VVDVVEEMTASGESIPLWFTETLQPKPPNKALVHCPMQIRE
jgi:hypothetical protein